MGRGMFVLALVGDEGGFLLRCKIFYFSIPLFFPFFYFLNLSLDLKVNQFNG